MDTPDPIDPDSIDVDALIDSSPSVTLEASAELETGDKQDRSDIEHGFSDIFEELNQ
jgi:hypothetical protein